MPKYDAGSDVEALEYDLTAAVKGTEAEGLAGVTGTVPEPSQDGIAAFFDALGGLRLQEQDFTNQLSDNRRQRMRELWLEAHPGEEYPDDATVTPRQLIDLQDEDRDAREAFRRKMRGEYIDVLAQACQGSPPRPVLEAMPHRHLQGFAGWLAGSFSPEASAAVIG